MVVEAKNIYWFGYALNNLLLRFCSNGCRQHRKANSGCHYWLAYVDDDQVTDILVRKRDLSGNFKVENMTPTLAEGFARGNEFIYIVVSDAPDQEVLT